MRNKAQGFTLIELLIVIAIIGILAAVLIPNLLNARSNAQNTAAEAFARNVATWIAAADTTAQGGLTDVVATFDPDCFGGQINAEGGPAAAADYPGAISACATAYAGGQWTVTVTSIPGNTYTATY